MPVAPRPASDRVPPTSSPFSSATRFKKEVIGSRCLVPSRCPLLYPPSLWAQKERGLGEQRFVKEVIPLGNYKTSSKKKGVRGQKPRRNRRRASEKACWSKFQEPNATTPRENSVNIPWVAVDLAWAPAAGAGCPDPSPGLGCREVREPSDLPRAQLSSSASTTSSSSSGSSARCRRARLGRAEGSGRNPP